MHLADQKKILYIVKGEDGPDLDINEIWLITQLGIWWYVYDPSPINCCKGRVNLGP